MNKSKEIKRVNCFFCYMHCGILVHVENGEIVKIEPDKEQPWSQGLICLKALRGAEFHNHPDRLNYPLKRSGERGEGEWGRISWEKGLNEVAERLKEIKEKYGPESIVGGRGTYRTHHWVQTRFFNLLGSPNRYSPGTICFCNTWAIHNATYGTFALPHVIPEKSGCIVIWGKNPAHSFPTNWKRILQAKKRGTKLITVDPRYTECARESTIWLQIRPTTDGALALGWLNVVIEEELYDKDFVEKWTVGFDKLERRVKEYTPERVSEITWIDAELIRESARMYATNKPAVVLWGVKLDQIGKNSTQAIRAICILRAITGNLDIAGGEMLGAVGDIHKVVPDVEMELNEKLTPEQRKKQLGADRFKLLAYPGWDMMHDYQEKTPYVIPMTTSHGSHCHEPTVWRAILTGEPYPVKALIITANNPILQATNSKLVYKALKSKNLELLVVMDYFLTPTAMLADYVFPATDWLERPVVNIIEASRHYIIAGERAVKPKYERQDDYDFYRGLGMRLGQKEYWPWESYEEALDYRFKPLGLLYEEFVRKVRGLISPLKEKKYEEQGFATPSGKVELYSTVFKKLGYDPLPYYEEADYTPISTPELARAYPLILTTGGRTVYFHHSTLRQIKSLRELHPDPIVEINFDTARRLGIKDGDWVWIETPLGKVRQRAKLQTKLHPKVVHAQHGWWFPEKTAKEPELGGMWESNINVLIDDDPENCDPVCGGWPHMTLCRVYKAAEYL